MVHALEAISILTDNYKIKPFWYVQESLDFVKVDVVISEQLSSHEMNQVATKIRQLLETDTEVCVNICDHIVLLASGKHHHVISSVKPDWDTSLQA